MKKETIHAMMDDDMDRFLKKNGYWDPLLRGEILCPCGKVVTHDNLTAMKPVDGEIKFYHSIICLS